MNKTFGYARVSTIDQNLDTQLDILTKATNYWPCCAKATPCWWRASSAWGAAATT
jgi:hypothetical protein